VPSEKKAPGTKVPQVLWLALPKPVRDAVLVAVEQCAIRLEALFHQWAQTHAERIVAVFLTASVQARLQALLKGPLRLARDGRPLHSRNPMVPLLSLGLIADLAGLPDEAVLLCKSLPLRVWHAIATDRVKRAALHNFCNGGLLLEEWRHSAVEGTLVSKTERDGIADAEVHPIALQDEFSEVCAQLFGDLAKHFRAFTETTESVQEAR